MRAPVVQLTVLALAVAGAASPASARAPAGLQRASQLTVTIEGDGVYGAGVLVAPRDGFVVTAFHVVKEMHAPRATFSDGVSVAARVVESDPKLDVALLQIPPQPARPQPLFGDAATLAPGDQLFAVGCPSHLPFTVSRGIVSFVGRAFEGVPYLQTDIPINPGNSGGPVVDEQGALVGIMSFVYRGAQGLSFALPLEQARARFSSRLKSAATTAASAAAGAAAATPSPTDGADRSPVRGPSRSPGRASRSP